MSYSRFLKKLHASKISARLKAFVQYGYLFDESSLFVAPAGEKGNGLFTKIDIKKGSLAFLATGPVIHAHFEGEGVYKYPNWYSFDKDLWIDIQPPHVMINHSCEPNLGLDGPRCFVALRNIRANEELTFDYSLTDDELDWEMECFCHSKNCSGVIGPIQTVAEERYSFSFPFINVHFREVYESHKKHSKG